MIQVRIIVPKTSCAHCGRTGITYIPIRGLSFEGKDVRYCRECLDKFGPDELNRRVLDGLFLQSANIAHRVVKIKRYVI